MKTRFLIRLLATVCSISIANDIGVVLADESTVESTIELLETGESLRRQGKYQDAIEVFNEALKTQGPARAYLARGRSWQELGDLDRAISDYGQAVKADPELTVAYAWRATCRHEKGELLNAVADYTVAISRETNQPFLFAARAQVWSDLGCYDLAVSDWSKAIELSPEEEPGLLIGRAFARVNLGEWSKVVPDIDKAIEKTPTEHVLFCIRGQAKDELGDYAGAIADYEHTIEVCRDKKELNCSERMAAVHQLSALLVTCPDEAYRDYGRAIDLAQGLCEATEWKNYAHVALLAVSYSASGNLEKAKTLRSLATKLAPEDRKERLREYFISCQQLARNTPASSPPGRNRRGY